MNTQTRDVSEHCLIRIDKEGRWYYEDSQIINENVFLAFCNALEKDHEGKYRIVIESELCYVDVEDTPFVVSSIRGDKKTGLYVLLNTSAVHELDPSTLSIGKDNVLYCVVNDGMKVRFTRTAYYLLALMMEEDEQGNITLTVGEKTYPVLKDPHFS
ncbi:MAG TPA: DUF1285 domain-containing protein [Deltaproteobacteria bacterium]|nr:DUF1285 domain-containing protein [Deltaproteobacteria bacterium]